MSKFLFSIAFVSIVVFSSCSLHETDQDTIAITAELDQSQFIGKADFSIDNNNQQVFEKVPLELTNNSTNAVSYLWDFGNDDTSTEKNPTYSYDNHGMFTVKLSVTDRFGNVEETSHDIMVICLFENQIHGSN